MSRSDLERLSKDELIELVLKLQRPGKTSRTSSKRNYPGGLEGSDGAQALIVLSTVPKGLAPAVSRAVATAVRTAASPLADHRARWPFVFLRWITAGLRSRSQALLVASTRPGKDANVSNWSRARRILFWMSRARSQTVGAARISSRVRSSVRRLAVMVDVARLPIPFAKAKAEPSHSLRRKATGSSPASTA